MATRLLAALLLITPAMAHAETPAPKPDDFVFQTERVGEVRVLRYQVPGFAELDLKKKQLLYYLYEAALAGRDIFWDQNHVQNLRVRRTLEAIYRHFKDKPQTPALTALTQYLKMVWISNGVHHFASTEKLKPGFSAADFAGWVRAVDAKALPDKADKLIAELSPLLFDPKVDAKRVNQDPKADLVATSANNYYQGVTQAEVEAFYAARKRKEDPRPTSWGLNSRLIKGADGKLVEQVWRSGGMYGPAIDRIIGWLEKAVTVAENPGQAKALRLLIEFYRTGDLAMFDAYCIAWLQDTGSAVDAVNGFIETYGDPLGYRGAFESIVSFRDPIATRRIDAISKQAQWFEDNSPLLPAHKKPNVTGISAKVITVVVTSGDSSPTPPIGVNLPNAEWIRAEHGSKSVNLGNVVRAYEAAGRTSGVNDEFFATPELAARAEKYGALADDLHTDMHEVIGHASGRLEPGVGTSAETLKAYASTLEEARADLVALYYLPDPKLAEIGVLPTPDSGPEIGRAAYDDYLTKGLIVQLARVELGANLEEAHARNRHLVAAWVVAKGAKDKVVERVVKGGKTYFVVRDYAKLRTLFGDLLREIQRIVSQGDYAAGKALVETYGVKLDPALHKEVRARYDALNIARYSAFLNPRLVPVTKDGAITDVRLELPTDFAAQMLEYAERYSFLK